MSTVYVISDYGKLAKRDESLCFTSPDGSERRIFLHRTDRIILAGSVELTASAIKLIMRHKIDTVFVSKNGRFNGKLEFQEGKNVFLRKRQYELLGNNNVIVPLVTSIVEGKLRNQLAFMQRVSRKREDNTLAMAIGAMQKTIAAVRESDNIDSIRGHEGYGARLYFSVLRKNIDPEWAQFGGRTMHPPKDNVNALLSFLYTLLLYRVDALVEMEGLDPYVGYLHALNYGKRALTFDLMEEYRSNICDTVACALFNLGILKEEHFETKEFRVQDEEMPLDPDALPGSELESAETTERQTGTLLSKDGLKKVVERFEEKMDTLILYPPTAERISYHQVIIAQIKHFKRVLMGEENNYLPFVVK